MTSTTDPPFEDTGAQRSSETVAILDFATPSGLTHAVDFATPSGLTRARIASSSSSSSGLQRPAALTTPAFHQPTSPTHNHSTSPGTLPGVLDSRRVIIRATIVTALLAAIAWGVAEVRNLTSVERHRPNQDGSTVTKLQSDGAAATAGAPDDALVDEFAVDDASLPGLRAQDFLRTHVKKDGELDSPAILLAGDAAIGARAITVVNFWATWCEPCKAEFSGFQEMFVLNRRDQKWGNETRFVPILVDDPEKARTAYRDWKPSMPDIHAALIDQKLDQDGVRGALQKVEALHAGPDSSLPVTLLFDCRQRIRWFKVGALDQAAFNALANQIDELRAELSHQKCKQKRTSSPSPPAIPTPAVPSTTRTCNQNGACDVREDCSLCPQDCSCQPEHECKPKATGGHFCKESI